MYAKVFRSFNLRPTMCRYTRNHFRPPYLLSTSFFTCLYFTIDFWHVFLSHLFLSRRLIAEYLGAVPISTLNNVLVIFLRQQDNGPWHRLTTRNSVYHNTRTTISGFSDSHSDDQSSKHVLWLLWSLTRADQTNNAGNITRHCRTTNGTHKFNAIRLNESNKRQ